MKKRTKREKIIRMMSERPELSLKEIAEKVGVNPQYVYTVKWEKKRNSNFVSKVFEKAGLKKKPMPEESKNPLQREIERLTVKKANEAYKKPSHILTSAEFLAKAEEDWNSMMAVRNKLSQNQPADLVNKPPHYTAGGIDFLDYAEAKGLTENAYLFNVVKYVSRAGRKVGSDPLEDLKKAEFYLKREIAQRERA